ncbi:increased DNA methylation 1-like [Quillaja saponaria]|uniref:Increased DNA methylation 1-like n=1 Tax=Quillaja saponaria TaxID=32244 RepID=A0AAD7LY84_QUISA|nr:increased DNA methylation 1-like [Quillaja saponaria]
MATRSNHSSALVPVLPDFCAEAITEYSRANKKSRSLRFRAKKHLLYLGWKIEPMEVSNGSSQFRYIPPNKSKTLYSLQGICQDLSNQTLSVPRPQEDHQLLVEQAMEEGGNPKPCRSVSERDIVFIEPEYCPQAVVVWYNIDSDGGYKRRNLRKSDLALKAKKHLAAMGWVFWLADKKGKLELRYGSPSGKCFYSLKTACKSCMDEGSVPCESIASNSEPSVKEINNVSQEIEVGSATPVSYSGRVIPSGRGKKRKNDSPQVLSSMDAPSLVRSDEKLDQSASIKPPKLKKGKVTLDMKKLRARKRGSQPQRVLKSSKRVRQKDEAINSGTLQQRNPRTILSWLIDNKVVLAREKVHYGEGKDSGSLCKKGRLFRDGIKCDCCSKVLSLTRFEAHAGSTKRRPAANIFLEDGRSLLDCQREALENKDMKSFTGKRGVMKENLVLEENDYICTVCHYGGELILCDGCPSSFHETCIGLEDVPDGDWFCPSCCCKICNQGKIKEQSPDDMEGEVLTCDQCEHKYHFGCLRGRGYSRPRCSPKENWFCSIKCESIFLGLQKLIGKTIPMGEKNLTWTLMKTEKSLNCETDTSQLEFRMQIDSKLNLALSVMHECFEPSIEPHTGKDLVEDVIFSRGSELTRLNFRGFYTVLLERDEELITVATVRIHGDKAAEVPLVATRFQFRRSGMCRILMNVLEKKLMELGVERMTLPAVPGVVNTWINSFGFRRMTEFERLQFIDYNFLDFQDTIMCQKLLSINSSAESIGEPCTAQAQS